MPSRHRVTKTLGLVLVVFILLFAAGPFMTLIMGDRLRDACFREVAYRVIHERVTAGCADDSSRVLRLFDFVHASIAAPTQETGIKDTDPLSVLIDGHGSCDQQANLFITLAAMDGLRGELLYLRGVDSLSHHALCTVQVNGRQVVLDPFTGQRFMDESGRFMQMNEVRSLTAAELRTRSTPEIDYARLLGEPHAAQLTMTNEASVFRGLVRSMIRIWCATCGRLLLDPYIAAHASFGIDDPDRDQRIDRLLRVPGVD